MKSVDAIVIGGGIAGISAAAELAKDMSVIVLEMEPQIGYHATGRSAAIFIRNYGNETLRKLNAASAPFLEKPDHLNESCLLSPRGQMIVANESEVAKLESYIEGSVGLDIISPAEACEIIPILRPEALVSAALEKDAQDIDVDRMLHGYARLLTANKGQIVTASPVTSIEKSKHNWCVTSSGHSFEAPLLVNAAGAWVDKIAELAQIKPLGMRPLRRSMALVPPPEQYDIDSWPLVVNASEQWYAKPEAGKLAISPADETLVDPHDAWADDMILAEGLYRFEQYMDLAITRVETSWAGLRSFTSDRSPAVGFDAENEGFFWLAGQGGYGVQTAPALATLTADLVMKRPTQLSQDVINSLNPNRF